MSEPLFPPPVCGAAVVCLRDDGAGGLDVLLVRRGRPPHEGRWSYPGGRVEPGEKAREAAAREAHEETGLRLRVLDLVDVFDAIIPPYHYCVADYLAEPTEDRDPQAGGDVTDAVWAAVAQIEQYEPTEPMLTVLRRAIWLRNARASAPASLGLSVPAHGRKQRSRIAGVYVLTDETGDPVSLARDALAGGARAIQLRDKQRDAGLVLPTARAIAALCRSAGALFIVNDRVDVALAAGADGVHLGQTDLPLGEARSLLGPDAWIGVSVEDAEQVRQAEVGGADYLGVGPIFGTATKPDAGDAVGLEQLRRFSAITSLPIVAIGGITARDARAVMTAGAAAVAVITAVSRAPDPRAATAALVTATAGAADGDGRAD